MSDERMIDRLLTDLSGHVEGMTERLEAIDEQRTALAEEEIAIRRDLTAAHEILKHSRTVVAKALKRGGLRAVVAS